MTETFADFLNKGKKPKDPLIEAAFRKIDELQAQGYRPLSRSAFWTREKPSGGKVYMCVFKAYPNLDDPEQHVFHIETWLNDANQVEVDVDGPFVDSRDEYWKAMKYRDLNKGNALITEDFTHYTVHKDSKDPGQGDGYGGSKFQFNLYSEELALHLKGQGCKVRQEDGGPNEGEWYLITRNLWQQGKIPKAHRHLFTPNCKIL